MWPMRATIGPCSPMRVKTKESIHVRSSTFPDWGWGPATASFVRRASAFSRKAGEPLILSPARKPEETLYVYRQEHGATTGEWRVSLGPDQPFAPPPPTWREHLRSLGHPLETHDDIERVCYQRDLPLEDSTSA